MIWTGFWSVSTRLIHENERAPGDLFTLVRRQGKGVRLRENIVKSAMGLLGKKNRKKIFSVIFVPGQDKDPRSISFSYARGKWFLALGCLLAVHMITGAISYFRVGILERTKAKLEEKNAILTTHNKKIEQIFREVEEIKRFDEMIRKGFGTSLGLNLEGETEVPQSNLSADSPAMPVPLRTPAQETVSREIQNSLAFLEDKGSTFFNPDYWPNKLPVEGFLTTQFQRGGWYYGRSHYGIDIAARKGSDIRAAGAGVVLISDWTPDFGNIIVIAHGEGVFSYYAHLLRSLVRQGTHVRKGQIIALLGSSGISTAPHLHFEIWMDGAPMNPADVLIALSSQKEEKEL